MPPATRRTRKRSDEGSCPSQHQQRATELNAHVIEGDVPPGLPRFRPNDQRLYHFILRWKCNQMLGDVGGVVDFRVEQADTTVQKVLGAVAIIVKWMNTHGACAGAAWLMSWVASEGVYKAQGWGELYELAPAAMHDPEYSKANAEYKANVAFWETKTVLLLEQ